MADRHKLESLCVFTLTAVGIFLLMLAVFYFLAFMDGRRDCAKYLGAMLMRSPLGFPRPSMSALALAGGLS